MGASSKLVVNEEKKFKGPLKKRPVDTSFDSIQRLYHKQDANFPLNMRSSQKVKIMHRISKDVTPDPEEESPPPTIAAGRSRRAIKPNPKYASEDMLTPKIIRNVVSGSTKGVTTPTGNSRHRNTSSSSDDFFNNDSSDEMDIVNQNDDDDGTDDIAYQTDEKDAVDSDFSEPPPEKSPPRSVRGRGRPRKIVLPESLVHTTTKPGPASSTRVIQIASSTVRSQPSQLQQLRRSLATSTAQRNLNLLSGEKRKLDSDSDVNVSVKRKLMVPSDDLRSTMKPSKENSNLVNTPTAATRIIRKIIPTSLQTLSDNKVIKSLANASNSSSEKTKMLDSSKNVVPKAIAHKAPLSKPVSSNVNAESKLPAAANSTGSFTSTQAKILAARATAAASRLKVDSPKQQLKDQLQSAPKTTNNNSAAVASQFKKLAGPNNTLKGTSPTDKISPLHNASSEGKPNSSNDDFETMPTFTIVNVNDIINKKKDVLITKSKSLNNSKAVCKGSITIHDEDGLSEKSEKSETKISIKSNSSANSNRLKVDTSRKGDTTTTTQHQILNHKIALRNARTAMNVKPIITTPVAKPAPRILNSVVAKKTRPVKPLISSLDDSADESVPLSMDDETEDEQDIKNKVSEQNDGHIMEEDESESSVIKNNSLKQKQQLQTKQMKNVMTVGNRKRGPVGSNSLSTVNQSSLQTTTRKITPEKVVISRQGDKIIKKITCFETWYVINVKNERPHYERSQFEMPLIKLANNCKTIPLPSTKWTCKVTLYELSVTTLAKSTFITYTGDLQDHNIAEEDRSKYQPSCVMFRRAVTDRQKTRMPYDRAVIFKNKTFYTNIEGKNVKLIAAPSIINTVDDVEILLQIVDSLSLQSEFVEQATTMQ